MSWSNFDKKFTIILTIIMILSIFANAVIAYTITTEKSERNSQDIKEIQENCKESNKIINENSLKIAVIETLVDDIKEIKSDVKDIRKEYYS